MMAIRVLATIPELPSVPDQGAAVVVAAPLLRPDPLPRLASLPAPHQARARASFPGLSIAALALVAAAVWSLVAVREATHSAPHAATPRIAAEPAVAGAAETTRR